MTTVLSRREFLAAVVAGEAVAAYGQRPLRPQRPARRPSPIAPAGGGEGFRGARALVAYGALDHGLAGGRAMQFREAGLESQRWNSRLVLISLQRGLPQ
jgi:hypothetical protein